MSRALVVVLLVACSGSARKPATTSTLTPAETPPDKATAALQVAATVRESYRYLEQGYDNAYLDGIAQDGHLIVIGVAPDEVFAGYDPRVVAARRLFGETYEEVAIWSKQLIVVAAADGTCVWTYDDIAYRVTRDGRRGIIPLRASSVYERREARWIKVMEHVSYAVPEDVAIARATPVSVQITDASTSEAVRATILASLAGPDPAAVSRELDALAVGITPGRELRGIAISDTPTAGALAGARAVETAGLRVELSRTGTVAWGAAILKLVRPEATIMARATWVLEQRQGGWRIVQTHLSVPVPEVAIAEELFGGNGK